jgi:diguanylate cyclase (GGDEF)-like protein
MDGAEVVRLVLIDDDPEERVIIAGLLGAGPPGDARPATYVVDWFGDPEAALRAMTAGAYDLCLLDYSLGAQTGFDVMDSLRDRDIDVPVIFLTGNENRDVDLEAMRRGAYDYLIKADLGTALLERAVRYARHRHRLQREIQRLSLHDPLTGLANRRQFDHRLRGVSARAQRSGVAFAVAYLDLDDFKPINDRFGHDIGDRVLVCVAERLTESVREADLVARLGGDEFAIILEDVDGAASLGMLLSRLREAVEKPIPVDGRTVQVGISIGVVPCLDGRAEPGDLVRRADRAMLQIKTGRRRTASGAA